MSGDTPIVAPTPTYASSLAPPGDPSRPTSASSNRSSTSSRKGRSGNSSSNSRTSSRGGGDGDKRKKSGSTTTISGGTSLGVTGNGNGANPKGRGGKKSGTTTPSGADDNANGNGRKSKPRPNPINPGPNRPPSQNSTNAKSPPPKDAKDSAAPISIHTTPTVPKTAMAAAVDAARRKGQESTGGDALSSLQKMISDLKAIPPSSSSSGGSQPGSRSASGTKEPPASSEKEGTTSPVPIPGASSSTKKLKADAPTFTPSFASSASPVASQAGISPVALHPQPQPGNWQRQKRSSSHGGSSNRRPSSTASIDPYSGLSPGSNFSALPPFGGFGNPLQAHPEVDNEDMTPVTFAALQDQQYQQQLLAAQQLQYQQIQLIQAQMAASQMIQQQAQMTHPQHQSLGGGFSAPRFQALAAQRQAQQQAQQAQQLAQAQQLFEIQQQQLLEYQQRQEENRARAAVEATLRNPPPVFEEDSPESHPTALGPTGRPQLAPTFTFGKKVRSDSASEAAPPQTPPQAPVINRSEGIGGAAATGLAGLAARAHKRTGSELTPAMQQQLDIQNQIEALQAKQKALMEAEVSKQGGTPLSQINTAIEHKRTPSSTQNVSRHRRVQSSLPSAGTESFGGLLSELDQTEGKSAERLASDLMPPPGGHARRHSVNVFAKSAGNGSGFGSLSIPEDGLAAPTHGQGHHRSSSRSGFESGSWRSGSLGGNGGPGGQVADLAAAQAQLQSLAQFRAAAGGGHSKMASFSFPNMLPNLLAATTLSNPAGQSLWQQQQAFQMQLQQTSSGPQRKSLFAPYLPQASLPPLLSAGKLVVGVLRVNKKNRSDAYVATDVLEADIYICGSKDRNRALEGDIVAVELLDVDEVWNTKKDKEEKKRKKEENSAYDLKPSQAKKLEKKKDDVEVEGQGLILFEDEEVNDDTKPTYAGHVVAVVERMPGQLFSGQLGVLRPSSAATKEKQELERREREGDKPKKDEGNAERPKIVWFKPTDKRVPLIAIPTEQAPSDFIENPDAYADKLFVSTIKRWPITSLHPFGTLVEELGPIGNVEVETSALLKDCNFPTEEFTDQTLKCIPPLPWTIPEREYEVRADLREERVFTIDPASAKDLDDALSIKVNDDGNYVVGVHIADVSYFVKANTALDRDARKRATSVYLVQRAVPMLPPQLSEELCSLLPGTERLAFSALFTIDKDSNVISTDFARTIVKSSAKLSYADAKSVLDGSSLAEGKVQQHKPSEFEEDIKTLHNIAKTLRERRIEAGALTSDKRKVKFELDEAGLPIDVSSERKSDANHLVEEFMLLANFAVARQIAYGLPEQALLRRHDGPFERRIDGFVKRAAKLGFSFDGTTTKDLQKGLSQVKNPDDALVLDLLKRKSMQRARYFCTGMLDIAKYAHWALNAPVYTHFTSPIRRYSDVLVHRMLDACISSPNPSEVKFLMDRDQVAKCAQQCNMKKASAKLAEDQSTHLFLCLLIHDLTEKYGPVVRQGIVTGVLDASFDVVIPEFGIEKRVHIDKMPLENTVHDEHKDILSLYWTDKDVLTFLAETTDDPVVKAFKARKPTEAGKDKDGKLGEQYAKSAKGVKPEYAGLRGSDGHKIQDIKELQSVPVIVTSDMTKSPPVLVVYASNPYAA